ncbi:MAG TPA: glycosyltransferase family 4 protein [Candidatus Acidoferrales bacterium]|nr:glycosyltransferase family 4 protein [Candidatus Acidoferrales bacterium]
MARVLIIQAVMKHYRKPFFTQLHRALMKDGIDLVVAYSDPNLTHAARNDGAELPDVFGFKVKGYWLGNRLLYQPLWKQIALADVVIVGPEIKYLINPILLIMSVLRLKTVAFWGLGPNRHPDRSRLAEWFKEHFFTKVDWWFAYTASIAEYLRKKGMPVDRITNVQNASDTAELRRLMSEISDEEVARAKETLTGTRDSLIGLYCGLIGEIKALPLLLETARQVKRKCPTFHLVLIGNGPDRSWLENAIANRPWIHYMGSKYGRESALYYKMSDVFLLAGTAGLAVVDSFAAGLPLLTTRLETHPPEISYVVDGENGRLAPHDGEGFAETILEVLSNTDLMARLRAGARDSGYQYTMEAMVEKFRAGIKECLTRYGASTRVGSPKLADPEAESFLQR